LKLFNVYFVFISLIFVFTSCGSDAKVKTKISGNCPSDVFTQSLTIFDSVVICGTSDVPILKLKHTANVIAVWLDNNEDGIVDNPLINDSLKKYKSTMIMSKSGFSDNDARIAMPYFEKYNISHQDLSADETNNPSQRDASQEETHHLVFNYGWEKVYPKVFSSSDKSSLIYKSWVEAEDKKLYSYDDETCDNACKVSEYIYKSTASYMNASSDLKDSEFTIKNQKDLRAKHKIIVDIFESSKYTYPQIKWPNGQYKFSDKYIK